MVSGFLFAEPLTRCEVRRFALLTPVRVWFSIFPALLFWLNVRKSPPTLWFVSSLLLWGLLMNQNFLILMYWN